MIITSPRGKANTQTGILFPILQSWNPMTSHATIVAQVDGKRVLCRIAGADLKKKFKSPDTEPMDMVKEHRDELENAARKLIEDNAYETDGSITIQYKDL
ncbi:MAG: DUF1488 domain-containing protein [Gammaproteobacteria bacterium]